MRRKGMEGPGKLTARISADFCRGGEGLVRGKGTKLGEGERY
jgi:hypothetical protein